MRVHIRYNVALLVIGPFGHHGVSLLYHEIPRHSCPRLLMLVVLGLKWCEVILVVAFTNYWIYFVLRYYWC